MLFVYHLFDLKENIKKVYINCFILYKLFYFTYFPDDNILIKIKYNKFFYPYQLIIKEKKKYGTILEVYTKDWKKEIVICQLMINILNNNLNLKNSNNKKFYSKINTFKEEALWKPIKQKTVDFGKNYRP